jgi:hypothetical protein
VLDRQKLESLKIASRDDNLGAAARICAELVLDAKGTPSEFDAEELALAVKLRDLLRVGVIANELMDDSPPLA